MFFLGSVFSELKGFSWVSSKDVFKSFLFVFFVSLLLIMIFSFVDWSILKILNFLLRILYG